MYYSNKMFSGVLRGFTSSHVEEPVSLYYIYFTQNFPCKLELYPIIRPPKFISISIAIKKLSYMETKNINE